MRGRRLLTTMILLTSLGLGACGPEGQTEETEQPGGASDDAGAITGGPTTERPISGATGGAGATSSDTTNIGPGVASPGAGDSASRR